MSEEYELAVLLLRAIAEPGAEGWEKETQLYLYDRHLRQYRGLPLDKRSFDLRGRTNLSQFLLGENTDDELILMGLDVAREFWAIHKTDANSLRDLALVVEILQKAERSIAHHCKKGKLLADGIKVKGLKIEIECSGWRDRFMPREWKPRKRLVGEKSTEDSRLVRAFLKLHGSYMIVNKKRQQLKSPLRIDTVRRLHNFVQLFEKKLGVSTAWSNLEIHTIEEKIKGKCLREIQEMIENRKRETFSQQMVRGMELYLGEYGDRAQIPKIRASSVIRRRANSRR